MMIMCRRAEGGAGGALTARLKTSDSIKIGDTITGRWEPCKTSWLRWSSFVTHVSLYMMTSRIEIQSHPYEKSPRNKMSLSNNVLWVNGMVIFHSWHHTVQVCVRMSVCVCVFIHTTRRKSMATGTHVDIALCRLQLLRKTKHCRMECLDIQPLYVNAIL
jgi:hypothetical protein